MLSKQQSRSGAKVVGIAGIGGVGKTTIAKEIFNSIVKDFKKIDVQINSIRKDFTKPRSKVAKKTTMSAKNANKHNFFFLMQIPLSPQE